MRFKSMKLALAVALALVPVVAMSGTAQAAPDHTITLAAGSQSWNGAAADGTNTEYDSATGTPCPETPTGPNDYCEQTLLHVVAGVPANVSVTLDDDPTQDFDLFIYNSNASAGRFGLVDSSANPQTLLEVATIADAPNDSYYLIQVVYFDTFELLTGYGATATITGVGDPPPPPADDLPTTTYYLHEDGPPPPPADPGTFDTTAPTATTSSVAPGCQCLDVTPQPQWTGNIPLGVIRRLKLDFFQTTFQEGLFGANYDVALIVGSRRYNFPFFTASPSGGPPGRVIHTFTQNDPGSPLPITFPGGPVTIEIAGHFTNAEAQFEIYYDSVNHPSNFVVNPPPDRAAFPPDVDSPPGLQEILASDPSAGWTSRSEMHIAQNPVNPNYLVAASKFYNKDADALAQYEFKIGSYISFDRGKSWTDLGQIRTCPASDPGSQNWPNNTCYPADDPAANDDVGEQYITSDPWVGWDDEGNAYAMVLDSPPFPPPPHDPEGRGWGMTMHRWDSVSPADVTSGNTWGPRMPISSYQSAAEQALLLDDKNTFAVNNAGPDGDGQSGILVACWGLNVADALKQAEVCRRSTDKGATWPVEFERVINDAEQLGIGISVVADEFDPNTFYAAYLQYLTSTAGVGGSTIEFSKTVDAGTTFTWLQPSVPVAVIDDIPRQFPGQSFRNLSIPIMAAGNRVGTPPMSELYITWAESRPTGSGGLTEAEIALVRSDNAGATWNGFGTVTPVVGSAHIKIVNGSDNNRDQFQPYVDVTPLGQVNVLYFDRRHDPDNYYVDTYLSRSNNRGGTFTDHRLSHDATDPEFNAPVSPSGKFFGDYQGLTVDNCFAYPFVNDTHLANEFLDPGPGPRDPDFDHTPDLPESLFQEAISWRVPNTTAFGGTMSLPCGADLAIDKTGPTGRQPTGRNMTYTLTVTNNGPDPAADVVVTDTLPPTVTFISANPSQGTCGHAAGIVTCNLGTLGNGASATIPIVVRPTQAGQITNVASVTASTEDAIGSNNSDSEQTTICRITSRPTSIPCP